MGIGNNSWAIADDDVKVAFITTMAQVQENVLGDRGDTIKIGGSGNEF